MEIKNFGSLYLNGRPSELKPKYNGEAISLGDTVSGKAISFVKWCNLWISRQVLCPGSSWNDLEKPKLISGHPVKIDDHSYLCRAPKLGTEQGLLNEWTDIQKDLGRENPFWDWDGLFFWGQEKFALNATTRVTWGNPFDCGWSFENSSARKEDVGFRPVLKLLPPAPAVTRLLVGSDIVVYGADMSIAGRLVDFSDYDLLLSPTRWQKVPAICSWAKPDGSNIVIDRASIIWMKEV